MSKDQDLKLDTGRTIVYEIKVGGHLGCEWTDWFEGMTITLKDDGETVLTGPVIDQAALYGVLKKVRNLGLPLLSVNIIESGPPTSLGTGQADVSNVKS